ncbi:hypothetical protein [Malacoplasma iowae]|nr:hypothetical protein [Malacoplasma iowae]WPL36753.1 hypothetical protein QX179_05005 [Malacoplasma iowae]WPL37970.1 hypothetical protein QX182_00375 [Malacoplasma iowae]WPL40061.1 hypothetical protein QX183_00735 [Malacoplasma iowae]WPL40524.1 hypothetical protein QX184_03195 [Malacoplasma iowae]
MVKKNTVLSTFLFFDFNFIIKKSILNFENVIFKDNELIVIR